MKKTLIFLFSLTAGYGYAVSDTAAVVGAATAQSAINSGMLMYWQSQGVQSSIVTTPTGASYVMPNNSSDTATQSPQNPYQTQNNQQSKQDFFNN